MNVAARILELLAVGLYPFCPRTSERLWGQLGLVGLPTDRAWNDAKDPPDPGGRAIGLIEHLARRIEDAEVERGVEALRKRAAARGQPGPQGGRVEPSKPTQPTESAAKPGEAAAKPAAPAAPAAPKDATYDDFAKLELKVAKVLEASPVEGADKLLKLELEVQDAGRRTVVSGIRPWYKPEELVGRQVVYFANLAPKKIRGVMSHGMVLAAHASDGAAVLLKPEKDVFPGSKIS